MAKRWGATPEEWAALKKLAKADLLPVVSNPDVPISPRSKMKGKGKTPSTFNHERQIIGFPDWTDFEATVKNIEAWTDEPDFGACVQTRRIRALDVDVPADTLSDEIAERWQELIGYDLPKRTRSDSGKQLLPFIVEGEIGKRSFVVKEWIDDETGKTRRWLVEFLATGQQFVAAGTHPDGARYTWTGNGPPHDLPRITEDDFDRAWAILVREFALEGLDRRAERRDPTLLEDLEVDDPVATFLIESEWPTYGIEKGMLYLECPNFDGHSTDNGETETAWLLAGTGKYRKGHFRCMHAGCGEITDAKFFAAVGYRPVTADQFDDESQSDEAVAAYVKEAPTASAKSKELKTTAKLPLPGLNRDGNGIIETSLENITRCLRAPQAADCELKHDEFRGELMIAEQPGEWRSFADADAVRLRMRLEALGFKDKIGKELMRDALAVIADEQRFDSAIHWLNEIVPAWDGVSRIRTFWPTYMQTVDSRYTRAMGDYMWTAMAGRVLDPGCQVDMVPVMVSPEGYAKTSVLAALVPDRQFFAEFNLHHDDDKLARLMRGTLIGELAELRGIAARDGEAIKSWITRRYEKWIPKYGEYATVLPRRLLLLGTTNDDAFMQSHMGERRWLPTNILAKIDIAMIEADRLQLWAEARDLWLLEGCMWSEVEALAVFERDAFKSVDPWADRVRRWLDEEPETDDTPAPRYCGTLRAEEVLIHCVGLDPNKIGKREQQRIGEVLKGLGMVRIQRKIRGENVKVWVSNSGGEGLDTGLLTPAMRARIGGRNG